MSALFALWLLSVALAGMALAIMSCLVIARALGVVRGRSREAERRRLLPLLLAAETDAGSLAAIGPASEVLTDLSIELVQIMRGADHSRLVVLLALLGVPEQLRRRLVNGAPRIRATAAEALASFADETSAGWLLKALEDPNADVRLSAAMALAASGHAPPALLLIDRLGIGVSEHSMRIVRLFQEIGKERPNEIRNLIEDERTPQSAKVAAIDALSASGGFALVPLIAGLALRADPIGDELPHYLSALGDFADPAGAPAVEQGLRSEAWQARAAAAKAAGQIGLPQTCGRLVALLNDGEWWVRFRAGEALTILGEEGRRLLRETAPVGPEPARTAARLTLAERGLAAT